MCVRLDAGLHVDGPLMAVQAACAKRPASLVVRYSVDSVLFAPNKVWNGGRGA